jgi:hypothetical protein
MKKHDVIKWGFIREVETEVMIGKDDWHKDVGHALIGRGKSHSPNNVLHFHYQNLYIMLFGLAVII